MAESSRKYSVRSSQLAQLNNMECLIHANMQFYLFLCKDNTNLASAKLLKQNVDT